MPAQELRTFTVTTPAGTTAAAPQVTALTMPPRIVRTIQVVVPPGPNGQLGFAFGAAGQPVIPVNSGGWIVTSDEKLSWDVPALIESGAWQCFTYNTGIVPHTIYIRMLADLVTDQAAPVAAPVLTPAQLAPVTAADLAAINNVDPAVLAALGGIDQVTADAIAAGSAS